MMMTFRADLHCHSTFSDGTDSPKTLIDLAIERGLSGLSITDHDTIAAYPEALQYARIRDFPLLPGVEFSASHQGHSVHVLGYGFSLQSEPLHHLCEWHKERRRKRNRKILEKLKNFGIVIEESGLDGYTVGRPHIAHAMMQKGVVLSIQEAFDRYLGEGKLAYEPGEVISVLETIQIIHAAKGRAVIAHPHLIRRHSLMRQLLKMPFDGLEGYYARFTPVEEDKWIRLGQERAWLITGGSDYHGETKPFNILGSAWVGKETFDALYENYLAANS